MAASIGNQLKITLFGQSHSKGMGVVIDGLPAGETIDLVRVQAFLERRAPGRDATATARKETDKAEILSGLVEGVTCGAPLCAVITNTDTRSRDYEELRAKPRPGHADYTAWVKSGMAHDIRGGGQFSGRLTAPLCFAGAVALQLLEKRGITVGAHIASVADIRDTAFDPVSTTPELLKEVSAKHLAVISDSKGTAMREAILEAKAQGDSVGGVVECCVLGLPAGLGEAFFGSIESRLAAMLFSIPAVKGVDFGTGFGVAQLLGSQNNDAFTYDQTGRIITKTNNHGGILGGITTGMPLLLQAAFKPTPSIATEQQTVDLQQHKNTTLVVTGRHDPCIMPRAVPVVEAAVAVTLLDILQEEHQ